MLLVIEDDAPFARDPAATSRTSSTSSACVADTADEGSSWPRQFQPSAIVLDINLPDHSGLSVLDQLKRNSATRHIPVHIVSAADYAQTALTLGAVGYALKPVKREAAGRGAAASSRRSFASEHAPRAGRRGRRGQRESLAQAARRSHDVEIVGVGTAAEASSSSQAPTFDCMVLDLTLPDASGYELLEKMAGEDAYAFPPVIVYTGRALSADEEQRLRRYSQSIIIKGARSPERLLDEVTLFLHQVEVRPAAERQRMLRRGAQPRRGARRPAHPGRRGRRAQHLRAVQRARAARRQRRDRAQRPRGARRADKRSASPARRSTWC